MLSRIITARGTRVAVAAALVATVFAFSAGSPTSAAPQTKTLTGSCSGADAASAGLLAAFGGTLNTSYENAAGALTYVRASIPFSEQIVCIICKFLNDM